jgi:hypothetical protein
MKMVAVAILVIVPKVRGDVQSVVRLKGDSIHISVTYFVVYQYWIYKIKVIFASK